MKKSYSVNGDVYNFIHVCPQLCGKYIATCDTAPFRGETVQLDPNGFKFINGCYILATETTPVEEIDVSVEAMQAELRELDKNWR